MPPREQAETTPLPEPRDEILDHHRVKAGYLAFVAHEMRNPLSTALWSAELLGRLSPEERAGPRGEKLAGMCLRTLARLRHLVEDHFLAERLAIHGIPIRLEAVDVADAVAAASARVSGASCAVELDGRVCVSADRAMLERALEALVAASAREGTPVRVTSSRSGREVTLRISGTAPDASSLRPPDRSTPSDPTGRALGVLTAKAVAEANGGSLVLAADGFLLTLPAGEAAEAGANDQ